MTVFSSIHDLNIAACYCDKIILMKKEYYGNLDGEKAIEHLLEELKLK